MIYYLFYLDGRDNKAFSQTMKNFKSNNVIVYSEDNENISPVKKISRKLNFEDNEEKSPPSLFKLESSGSEAKLQLKDKDINNFQSQTQTQSEPQAPVIVRKKNSNSNVNSDLIKKIHTNLKVIEEEGKTARSKIKGIEEQEKEHETMVELNHNIQYQDLPLKTQQTNDSHRKEEQLKDVDAYNIDEKEVFDKIISKVWTSKKSKKC